MSFCYTYPRPALTVDCILLRINEGALQGLFIKRDKDPFQGMWALPGGFMEIDETPETAVKRELKEETNISIDNVIQVGAFGAIDRDPRGRTISIAFLAFNVNGGQPKAGSDAEAVAWLNLEESLNLAFDHTEILEATLRLLAESMSIHMVSTSLGLEDKVTENIILLASSLTTSKSDD